METLWHSKGTRHWQPDVEDWLCLRRDGDSTSTAVIFHEDTHHYFKELYILNEKGETQLRRRLEGPGPFEVEKLENVGACFIIVRIHFFGYSLPQLHRGGAPRQESCAVIFRPGGQDTVCMAVDSEPTLLARARATCPTFEEAVREFMRLARGGQPVLEPGSNAGQPFRLKAPVEKPVTVFLLGSVLLPADFKPGAKLPLEPLRRSLPCVTIAAGQISSVDRLPREPWSVAVPAIVQGTECVIGKPLIVSPLLAKLELDVAPPDFYINWDWLGPRPWLEVKLSWFFYNDDQQRACDDDGTVYPDAVELVKFTAYERHDGVKLRQVCAWRGWNVCVRVHPVLMGLEGDPLTEAVAIL